MIASKSLVIDLTKCQWATLDYRTRDGYTFTFKPPWPTVHGQPFREQEKHMSGECTMLEFAIANRLLDNWYPVCTFQLSANHTVTYAGDKAISMYDAWKAKIFSKALRRKERND